MHMHAFEACVSRQGIQYTTMGKQCTINILLGRKICNYNSDISFDAPGVGSQGKQCLIAMGKEITRYILLWGKKCNHSCV